MRKAFIVLSGTAVGIRRERAPTATEALRMFRDHIKFRRPGVRVTDELGNPVSFFQLKELAESESRENGSRT